MLFFLQTDTASKVGRFFETSPDTVYGLLTGALAAAVVALWLAFMRRAERDRRELLDIILKNVEAMNLIGNNIERLRDANEDDMRSLADGLERLRQDFVIRFDTLAQKIKKQ